MGLTRGGRGRGRGARRGGGRARRRAGPGGAPGSGAAGARPPRWPRRARPRRCSDQAAAARRRWRQPWAPPEGGNDGIPSKFAKSSVPGITTWEICLSSPFCSFVSLFFFFASPSFLCWAWAYMGPQAQHLCSTKSRVPNNIIFLLNSIFLSIIRNF